MDFIKNKTAKLRNIGRNIIAQAPQEEFKKNLEKR